MPKEAQVVAGTQPGDHQPLFGFRGSGLLHHGFHAVQVRTARIAAAADSAELREQPFAGHLDGGYGALLGAGTVHQPSGTAFRAGDVQMIAHQVEERTVAGKLPRGPDGSAITGGPGLGEETQASGMLAGGLPVAIFVARENHHADFFHSRAHGLGDQNSEHRLLLAVAVNERLQGKESLICASRSDYRFVDLHDSIGPCRF